MKWAALLLFAVSMASCSLPESAYERRFSAQTGPAAELFSVRIEHKNIVVFTGLLAIQASRDLLAYALLDNSGFTLLRAEFSAESGYRLDQAAGKLAESALPDTLATALQRIFLLEPEQQPCSRDLFSAFCKTRLKDGSWHKNLSIGPFTIWEMNSIETGGGAAPAIIYSQPWQELMVKIESIQSL